MYFRLLLIRYFEGRFKKVFGEMAMPKNGLGKTLIADNDEDVLVDFVKYKNAYTGAEFSVSVFANNSEPTTETPRQNAQSRLSSPPKKGQPSCNQHHSAWFGNRSAAFGDAVPIGSARSADWRRGPLGDPYRICISRGPHITVRYGADLERKTTTIGRHLKLWQTLI